jgi:nucleoid-associated protein YgaU
MRVLALAAVIVAIAAAVWWAMSNRGAEEPEPVPAEQTTAPDAEPGVAPPTFDIVRVDRSGRLQMAGRGNAGDRVELIANGTVITTEEIGPDGQFAMFTDTPLDAGPVELTLRQISPDGNEIIGEETVIVYVPEDEDQGPIVLRTTPGGTTEVLQRAAPRDLSLGPLSIDTIDYDAEGNVIFTGRAEPGSVVQVFASGQPLAETQTDQRGVWSVSGSLAPGRYTLQIVQLDENGRSKYAIEVPFEQASQNDIVFSDGNVVVQPGNNLWMIARRAYGEGEQYTVIYEANAGQIRNPDLIFPGQTLRVPEGQEP